MRWRWPSHVATMLYRSRELSSTSPAAHMQAAIHTMPTHHLATLISGKAQQLPACRTCRHRYGHIHQDRCGKARSRSRQVRPSVRDAVVHHGLHPWNASHPRGIGKSLTCALLIPKRGRRGFIEGYNRCGNPSINCLELSLLAWWTPFGSRLSKSFLVIRRCFTHASHRPSFRHFASIHCNSTVILANLKLSFHRGGYSASGILYR